MKVQIYTLSHPVTNEIRYVGRTIRGLSYRLYQHVYYSKKSNHYTANWIKSLVNIGLKPKIELLDLCDEKDWDIIEQYWISQLKTWGLRLTNDCAGGCGNLQPSNATRLKIASAVQKSVIQYSLTGNFIAEYKSITEASKKTNIDVTQIVRFLKSPHISARHFIWKYKYSNIIAEVRNNRNKHNKYVSQFSIDGQFIQKFDSISSASMITDTNQSSISNCCNNKLKSANNFQWKYYEPGDENKVLIYKPKNTAKIVLQLSENENIIAEYSSVKIASQKTNIDKNNISACCLGRLKTSGGYVWRYK